MTRKLTLLLVFVAASISAFANVGFCPPPATATACSTPTGGPGTETITVAGDTFGMYKLGAPGSDDPWYLLISVPFTDPEPDPFVAPTITSTDFTVSAGVDAGDFLPTTAGDIYAFAAPFDGAGVGNNSMNATNMFGSQEQAAFGSTERPTGVGAVGRGGTCIDRLATAGVPCTVGIYDACFLFW